MTSLNCRRQRTQEGAAATFTACQAANMTDIGKAGVLFGNDIAVHWVAKRMYPTIANTHPVRFQHAAGS